MACKKEKERGKKKSLAGMQQHAGIFPPNFFLLFSILLIGGGKGFAGRRIERRRDRETYVRHFGCGPMFHPDFIHPKLDLLPLPPQIEQLVSQRDFLLIRLPKSCRKSIIIIQRFGLSNQ